MDYKMLNSQFVFFVESLRYFGERYDESCGDKNLV